jgi:hypothetical protein
MSTSTIEVTTSSGTSSHVVTTVEEAEEILRELWFGWFEGIYNQDVARIKEVVGTQAMLDAARDAFGSASFESVPTLAGIAVSNTEILRSDEECLATYSRLDISGFAGSGSVEESVVVLRRVDDQWKLATLWINRNDLWETDCDSVLEPLS